MLDGITPDARPRVLVIGNGMVGHRFCTTMARNGGVQRYQIVTLGEERHRAYDRVNLTKYISGADADALSLCDETWYEQANIELRLGHRAVALDRERRCVETQYGEQLSYDHVILATGSTPFVPPIPGTDRQGVFVYRTIEDLDGICQWSDGSEVRRALVVGGGLLGLEAAKALIDLGLETIVAEVGPWLMPRQLDRRGGAMLRGRIEALGVEVRVDSKIVQVDGDASVNAVRFDDDTVCPVDMVVIAAGIRPRDDLARLAGLAVASRGGVVVDDHMVSSDPEILAIGEVASHRDKSYGLVGPGYEMAEVAAARLMTQSRRFVGADTSTKLKLLGIDVASFGAKPLQQDAATTIAYEDGVQGIYKRVDLSPCGTKIRSGILVGDAAQYATLAAFARSEQPLVGPAADLIVGKRGAGVSPDTMPDGAQVCSCENVTKGEIVAAIERHGLTSTDGIKSVTRAGTGCGGCKPTVIALLASELEAKGQELDTHLCEHFAHSRQELFHLVKVGQLRSFSQVLAAHGTGSGCEVCKPTVASVLASAFGELVLDHDQIQDTNDRFLANIQRTGLYSVVPRIPGGEITPDKLIRLGEVAKKYGLYTKVTGGQRIDLFGAHVSDLPEIWEELIDAGFESGHAYGKAMRTVKSCVGSSWCRFGVGDSTGLAIAVEQRYRGLRAPHKLKSAVSGCVRECAEAQSKDFGIIATDKGWNLYVGGNGGARPRHADLLASDLDRSTLIRIIDRFLMFYIRTADKLTRTSTWIEKLEGGVDYLRRVVVDDELGICGQLEREMAGLVATYKCEWTEVVRNPQLRRKFTHFVNDQTRDDSMQMVPERSQPRPADWPSTGTDPRRERGPGSPTRWVGVGRTADFPTNGGACVKVQDAQIAVFNVMEAGGPRWYATQNRCPHKLDMVLARGLVGDHQGTPKVACPMHKKTFSLQTGDSLDGERYRIQVFAVRIRSETVEVELPATEALGSEPALCTHRRLPIAP